MKQLINVVALIEKANPQAAMERNADMMIASDEAVEEIAAPYKTQYIDDAVTLEFGELAHLLHMAFSAGADWQINTLFDTRE